MIHIDQELADEIAALAKTGQTTEGEFVSTAVRAYIAQVRRDKIRAETEAFDQQHDQLLQAHPGEYVAIHQGKVIDHDKSLRDLHLRVFEQLGRTPVLLKQVVAERERELVFRSPRLERKTDS